MKIHLFPEQEGEERIKQHLKKADVVLQCPSKLHSVFYFVYCDSDEKKNKSYLNDGKMYRCSECLSDMEILS